VKAARNIAILLLISLGLTLAPGGDAALQLALTALSIAFFVAIAFLGYRLYREHRSFTLGALDERRRLILYSAVGLAFLTFAASNTLFAFGGAGIVVWLALLALSSYAVFWVFTRGV
jgi:hypothetical protein